MKTKIRRTRKSTDPPDWSYLEVNNRLIKLYGAEVAVFISKLVNKHFYWKQYHETRNEKFDGFFFYTNAEKLYELNMSEDIARKCQEVAVLEGWITIRKKGRPSKDWYKLNMEHPDIQLVCGKTDILDMGKSNIYKNKLYKKEFFSAKKDECPLGWEFGSVDERTPKEGCRNCEDETHQIYLKCKLRNREKNKHLNSQKEE